MLLFRISCKLLACVVSSKRLNFHDLMTASFRFLRHFAVASLLLLLARQPAPPQVLTSVSSPIRTSCSVFRNLLADMFPLHFRELVLLAVPVLIHPLLRSSALQTLQFFETSSAFVRALVASHFSCAKTFEMEMRGHKQATAHSHERTKNSNPSKK